MSPARMILPAMTNRTHCISHQSAAAEALLHLNKISSAHIYLSACDEQYRDVEWHFLKANLDQSARSVRKQPGDSFASVALSPDGRILAAAGSR